MKTIEIYDYDTNKPFMTITSKKKHFQKDVISHLENKGFNLLLQGSISPYDNNIHWSAYNPTIKEKINLWYREKELPKYYILDINLNFNQELKKKYEDAGYFCYDIQDNGFYDDGSVVVKTAPFNHIGSVITTEDLQLDKDNPFIKLDDFMSKFVEMPYQDFLKITNEDNDYEMVH